MERAKRTEPYAYLMKPVKPSELQIAIEIARHRHALERRLRQRDRWLTTALRCIPDGVVLSDALGMVSFLNRGAEAMLRTSIENAQARATREIVRLEEPSSKQAVTPLEAALTSGASVQVSEVALNNSPGRVVSCSAAPVMDGPDLLGGVMVIRDITEHRLLQKQLEVTDRLSSLGTMAAGVAHEINNPLAVIVGNAELVLEYLEHADRARPPRGREDDASEFEVLVDAQKEVVSAAKRIARIVADLRAFSRPQSEMVTGVDVLDAIEWAIRSTSHELRHRARLVQRLAPVPLVDGDDTRLGQVFVNLLMNAAQAIPPGDVEGNEVTVSSGTDARGHVVVEVRDTGLGIPKETQQRMFDPFFTTKAVSSGTGLGLSICKRIVEALNGSLSVTSELGKGTTLRLELPPRRRRTSRPPKPEPVSSELRGRLMVIDDEEMVLRALQRILANHDLTTTPDAREALACLMNDAHFDIIFCDLMMPNMTGMEFYLELSRLRPELAKRVVFLTGGSLTLEIEEFLESVPNECRHKPFSVGDLRDTVQRILRARSR